MRILFLLIAASFFLSSGAQYYPVPMNDKVGYINEQGAFVKPTAFLDGRIFSEGLAAVTVIPDSLYQKWYFVDTTLQIRIKTGVADPQPFQEGMAAVKTFRGWNYLDTEGNIAIKGDYDSACAFYNGYARVKLNGRWSLIDQEGRYVLNPNYTGMTDYPDRVLATRHQDDTLFYYVALSGDTLIPEGYVEAKTFVNGLGLVKRDSYWEYLNLKGEKQLEVYVDEAFPFYGQLALVRERDNWYFLNRSGEIDKSRALKYPVHLKRTLTWVEFTNGNRGYINQRGEWVYQLKPEDQK